MRLIVLDVQPGQCVAILGATGAGKSVLMSLVPRFFDPTAGRGLIAGTDARQIELAHLRGDSRLVFSESFLFFDTVAGHLAVGHPQAPRGPRERAAKNT